MTFRSICRKISRCSSRRKTPDWRTSRAAQRNVLLQLRSSRCPIVGPSSTLPDHADSPARRTAAAPCRGGRRDLRFDGKIDRLIDRRDVRKTLLLHANGGLLPGGVSGGAYQEILGDLHLFGNECGPCDDGRRRPGGVDTVAAGDTVRGVPPSVRATTCSARCSRLWSKPSAKSGSTTPAGPAAPVLQAGLEGLPGGPRPGVKHAGAGRRGTVTGSQAGAWERGGWGNERVERRCEAATAGAPCCW